MKRKSILSLVAAMVITMSTVTGCGEVADVELPVSEDEVVLKTEEVIEETDVTEDEYIIEDEESIEDDVEDEDVEVTISQVKNEKVAEKAVENEVTEVVVSSLADGTEIVMIPDGVDPMEFIYSDNIIGDASTPAPAAPTPAPDTMCDVRLFRSARMDLETAKALWNATWDDEMILNNAAYNLQQAVEKGRNTL